ncbi:polysaccharide biosynthesis/export family protein [Mucilaginibacter sp.]|uniref:polysaccharide biosynthesis/export family protein n=1 Tax=Mucilaginibacter sp. TaxID=1882438 RepID=UPI0035BC11D1
MLFQNTPAPINDTSAQNGNSSLGSYRIHPLDQLQIRNLQSAKFLADPATNILTPASNTPVTSQGQIYQVEEDGTVALPEIGHIKVADLTRIQATKLIEDLYRKSVLVNPVFEIKVINLKVTLLGEAKSPGNFPLLKDNTTLVELIGQAGGLTPSANEKNIKIIRGDKVKTVTEIDLSKISSISDPRAVLQNGDIIYIAQNKRAVRNDNIQNVTTVAQPALLLINTALLIFNLSRL